VGIIGVGAKRARSSAMPSVEERLDRIERQIDELRESVAYLRGVVEQLDKRFSEFRGERIPN